MSSILPHLISQLTAVEQAAAADIAAAPTLMALEQVKSQLLGKKSQLTEVSNQLIQLGNDDKKQLGRALNETKKKVEDWLTARKETLAEATLQQKLAGEAQDLTLPAPAYHAGKLHPINQTMEEAFAILGEMNFVMATGPEIETDFYNFTALNMPPAHPARQMQDTFYLAENHGKHDDGTPSYVLRTHTSPVQIRATERHGAPIRIMAPGRVYRADSDMTHTPMFHQIEGLVIDKTIHFGHLKSCLLEFCRSFFELADWSEQLLRFRPSYFPFTEPSAEVDIAANRKDGKLTIGTGDSWLEILGSGMVHPTVITNMGLDPRLWQGFAFGMGVERLAMLKYGIPDLRTFFDGDLRWLEHYGFRPFGVPSLLTSLVS